MAFGDRKKRKYRDFAINVDGEIVYNGDMYVYADSNPSTYAGFRLKCGLSSAGAALSALISGTFTAPGTTGSAYLIFPLMLTIVFSILALYHSIGILRRGDKLRKFDIEGRYGQLKEMTLFTAVTGAVTMVSYFVYLSSCGRGECTMVATSGFGLLMILATALSAINFTRLKSTVWEIQK